MGAIIDDGTVTFRVWAPNADKVFVAGSFNNWSESEIPLEIEENGYWSVKRIKLLQEMNTNTLLNIMVSYCPGMTLTRLK